jgi:hypothetical protein
MLIIFLNFQVNLAVLSLIPMLQQSPELYVVPWNITDVAIVLYENVVHSSVLKSSDSGG